MEMHKMEGYNEQLEHNECGRDEEGREEIAIYDNIRETGRAYFFYQDFEKLSE